MMRVRGVSDVQNDLSSYGRRVRKDAVQLTETTGRLIEADAKQNAPVDMGKLRQSISYEPINGGLGARDSVNVPYAPYAEFGTGGLVEVPPGFEELATSFKGSGKRTVNRAPHPFLIPAWHKYKDLYAEKLKRILNQ